MNGTRFISPFSLYEYVKWVIIIRMDYKEINGQIYIVGGNEGDHVIEVPERVDEKLVTGIERYAFRDRMELTEVVLPQSIHYIGGHAFYNCKNLKRVVLHDGVRELEDGAFKNCYRLTEVVLYCHANREACLRNLLSDNIQELTLTIHYDDGQVAKVLFPTFEDDYVENTPARIFQAVSFGSGGLYRQCLQIGTLDYKDFDELFEKSVREDRFEAGLMNAVNRLLYPYKLYRSAKQRYEDYLRENDREAGLKLVELHEDEGIRLMCERELISENAIEAIIEVAQLAQNVPLTGLLMQYRLQHFAGKRQTFDL